MPTESPVPPTQPAVRASHLKENVAALPTIGPALEARIRERVSAATLRTIEDATRVDWLPLELDVELSEAVFQVAGEARTRAWARASFDLALNTFFKPLLDSLVRIVDPTPHRIYALLPSGWPAVYRNSGSLGAEQVGPCASRIVARDLPSALMNEPFLRAVAGTLEHGFMLTKLPGRVELLPFVHQTRTVTWVSTWHAND